MLVRYTNIDSSLSTCMSGCSSGHAIWWYIMRAWFIQNYNLVNYVPKHQHGIHRAQYKRI